MRTIGICLSYLTSKGGPPASEHALTTGYVTHSIGVYSKTVQRWSASGRLPAINIGTAERPIYRFSAAAIAQFIAAHTIQPVIA